MNNDIAQLSAVNTTSSQWRLYALLTTLIIAWSLNTVFAKVGLAYMPPIWLTFFRLVIGAATATGYLAFKKQLVWPKRQDWPFILSIGLLQIGLFQLFFNYGMLHVHAGRASILTYATPLWVAPFAILFFGEKLTGLKLLGILLGIGGIFVLFSPSSFTWSDSTVLIGNGFLLASSLCWAIVMMHTRYGKWHSSPIALLPWQLLIACIIPALLTPTEPFANIHWNLTLILILLFSGVIATAFGYWMSITLSRALPVITMSLSLLSVPVITLLLSAMLIDEALTLNNLLAVTLIVSGLIFIALDSKFSNANALKK